MAASQGADNTLLDHSSVATLRAVTEATQTKISAGPTTWADVETLLLQFGSIDILIRDKFPGARVVSDIADSVSSKLKELGHNPQNTLFASSICPDEINHDANNLGNLLSRHWGECFQMGGLAGIPFSGQTGFTAYSHHVPDDGHLFILYAPHVGISPEGEFGLYARHGQVRDQHGFACGAAIGAYNHVCHGGEIMDFTHLGQNPYDYQMNFIISKLAKCVKDINSADNKMVEISRQMYQLIDDFMQNIVQLDDLPGSVILLGGILINTPHPMEDFSGLFDMKLEIK